MKKKLILLHSIYYPMRKITALFIVFAFAFNTLAASDKKRLSEDPTKPKLVIGVVVDQMRYDYIRIFYDRFGEGGFKKLINEGYHLENTHYNYIPTYTAVGHTSIFTGTTPDHHGIIGNNWYDKELRKSIYCVDDSNYQTVGADMGGQKSPYRMVTTTITDQLKLAQNMRGKTIGIAIKDRSSILPAGHTADAAYWFEGYDTGKFITSTFYMDQLPKWVNDFNDSGIANDYLNRVWDTYFPIETYSETIADNNPYEGGYKGKDTPTFPYDLSVLRHQNGNYNLLKEVAFGNSFTVDFAKAAIKGENLGKGDFTDFLTVSFSTPDYIGHNFGTNAKEIEDNYIRLDKDLEHFIAFLDKEVGKDNYTLFLTADHAAVPVPAYLQSLKIPSRYLDNTDFKNYVNELCSEFYNSTEIIEAYSNGQFFLNHETLKELGLNKVEVAERLAQEIINYKDVYKVVTAKDLQTTNYDYGILSTVQNGYNQKYSGDIVVVPFPASLSYSRTGTSHGSGYNYDTHIPLIFYGKGIKQGSSDEYYRIIDIAPTIASLLNITRPNSCTGRTITEALE